MGWIAAAILYLGVLFVFPRAIIITTVGLIALGVASMGVLIGLDHLEKRSEKARRDAVIIHASHTASDVCFPRNSILVEVTNNSTDTISGHSLGVAPHRSGYSAPTYIPVSSTITSTKLIAPGETFLQCYVVPSVTEFVEARSADELQLHTRVNRISFVDE